MGLAAVGFAISAYFTVAYYGSGSLRWVPAVLCRTEERTCTTILRTPYARLFGVPNAVVGLAFYASLAGWAAWTVAGEPPGWIGSALLAASVGTVVVAPYLVWALVSRLRVWCGL